MSATTRQSALPLFDRSEVLRTLNLLHPSPDVFELRLLKGRDGYRNELTYSGYFDQAEDAATALEATLRRFVFGGAYVTLNAPRHASLARCARKIEQAGKDALTKDPDISRRSTILIDCDPVREGGISGISASDVEKRAALGVSTRIREALAGLGFPAPVFADSGNGYHILLRVDLPAADGDLVKHFLEGLAAHFGTPTVTVDVSVSNPARISKIYGTAARKGSSMEERPHRMARLLEVPDPWLVVPAELLRETAERFKPAPKPAVSRPSPTSSSTFSIDRFVASHLPQARDPEPWQGGRKWTVDPCVFNPDHTGTSAALMEFPSGALSYTCLHNGCAGRKWEDVRELLEPKPAPRPRHAAAPSAPSPEQDEPPIEAYEQESARPVVSLLDEAEGRLLASVAGNADAVLRVYDALGRNTNRMSTEVNRGIFAGLVALATTDRPPTLANVAHAFSSRGGDAFSAQAERAKAMVSLRSENLDLAAELRFIQTAYGFRDAERLQPKVARFEGDGLTLDQLATAQEDYARRIREMAQSLLPLATAAPMAVHLDDALRELVDEEDDSADWLVDGLIGKQSIGMLAGEPQIGKSTLAVQLAVCLANGRDVLGRRCFAPKRVLYLIAEGSRAQFLTRLGKACRALNLPRPSGPWFMQAADADVFDIAKPGFEFIIANERPDLVILDTCYKFAPGCNENHADEWRSRIYYPLFRFSGKLKTSFLLLHHENKSKDGKGGPESVAGTYAQYADTDSFMRLRASDGDGNLMLHLDKVRGRPKMTVPMTLDGEHAIFAPGYVQRRTASEEPLKPLVLTVIAELAAAGDDGYVKFKSILDRLNETTASPETTAATLTATLSALISASAIEKKLQTYRIPPQQKVLEFKVPK